MSHLLLVAGLKSLELLCLASHGLDIASDPLSSHGITSDSNSYGFHDCLDGLWRQRVCIVHSMHAGFRTVLGDVPWLVTVVTGPRWVLGLCTIEVHGLQVCSRLAAGGGGHGSVSRGWSGERWSSRVHWGHGGGGGVLGCCHLRAGSIESPPLVVKNRGLALPLNPSPGHWAQSINALPQAGVECLLEVVDQSDVS